MDGCGQLLALGLPEVASAELSVGAAPLVTGAGSVLVVGLGAVDGEVDDGLGDGDGDGEVLGDGEVDGLVVGLGLVVVGFGVAVRVGFGVAVRLGVGVGFGVVLAPVGIGTGTVGPGTAPTTRVAA